MSAVWPNTPLQKFDSIWWPTIFRLSSDRMFWAHTVRDQPETVWEPLDDHLRCVGARAAELAAKFGAGDFGRIAGLLHDLGKAKPAFRAYLRGGKPEPHAAEGAKAAYALLPKPFGRMLAFGIAGHHAGLANGISDGGGLSSLDERLEAAGDLTAYARSLNLPELSVLPAPLHKRATAFSVQFFIRMLFSCLVDADRLATEAFYAERNGERVERGWSGELETLKSRLDAHLAAFGDPETEVDRHRADVLAACRAAAALRTGLFSLSVPTGGGKTLSSLAFALDHALRHGLDRVIYVIPFTSIIDQTAVVFRRALQDTDGDIVLEHHSAFDWEALERRDRIAADKDDDEGRDGVAKLRRAAENWDRPIVVTTAVQFFESLFSHRPSRCRKLHAIARAVVVLDEAQTLPLKLLRPCLAACTELTEGYRSSVVLCTATQPAVRKDDGFKPPEGLTDVHEIIPKPKALYAALKRTRVIRKGVVTDAELVEVMAEREQILVIVNNRLHARDLADALIDRGVPGARLLTTALTAADRRVILEEIRDDLKAGRPVRLAASSLIESGVDISFPIVLRSISGIDSIAQASGRCNREGELGTEGGEVMIFQPEEGRKVPRELERFAEVAGFILPNHPDPLAPQTVKAYFKELYRRYGEKELDTLKLGPKDQPRRGVMNAISKGYTKKNSKYWLEYPFADIGAVFRLIENTMVPIIVPAGPNAPRNAPQHLIDDLRKAKRIGGLARKLQPYLVQTPRVACATMMGVGVVQIMREREFGDQFIFLTDPSRYDPIRGLDWAEPELRSIEEDII